MDHDPDDRSFTLTAVILGSLCGGIIAVANMYLGLKTGISIGATLFCTLLGSMFMAPFLRMQGRRLGIREHTCFQAAGTGAGGMNGGLVAPVLVLFWNGYFTGSVGSNVGSLLLLVFGAGGFGIVFAAALRKYSVVKQNLVFPDGTAAAVVLQNLYSSKAGAEEGAKKTRVMLWAAAISFVLAIAGYFVPVLLSQPVFQYLSCCSPLSSYAECQALEGSYPYWMVMSKWGFALNLDPVFMASGMMV